MMEARKERVNMAVIQRTHKPIAEDTRPKEPGNRASEASGGGGICTGETRDIKEYTQVINDRCEHP